MKKKCYLLTLFAISLLPTAALAEASKTLAWLINKPAVKQNTHFPDGDQNLTSLAVAYQGKPEDECQTLLEENDLSPDDVVWIAINPGDELVPVNAQQACEVCYVGSGNPSWMCEPYDPVDPGGGESSGGSGSGFGGGDGEDNSGGSGSGFGGGDEGDGSSSGGTGGGSGGGDEGDGSSSGGTGGGSGGSEIDVIMEVNDTIENNTNLSFRKLSRNELIRSIRDWFLPRNVDAQPRAFTDYGINLFHGLIRSECPDLTEKSSMWASGIYSREGENGDRLLWNNYDSINSGLAIGTCLSDNDKDKYGFLVHLGRTTLKHEGPTPGNYESNNFGGGIYYIGQREAHRITANLLFTFHDGEQLRDHHTYTGYRGISKGDRDSTSTLLNLSYEGTDDEALFKPFASLSLSYIHQDDFVEEGFPLYTLQFDSRDTWWLGLEGGLKWEKVYETSQKIDYHLLLAGALNFLTNISDETQYFTYTWGRTVGIPESGDNEYGAALHFGLKRKPKDNDKMRVELSGTTGYRSKLLSYTALLNFVFPFGSDQVED